MNLTHKKTTSFAEWLAGCFVETVEEAEAAWQAANIPGINTGFWSEYTPDDRRYLYREGCEYVLVISNDKSLYAFRAFLEERFGPLDHEKLFLSTIK